LIGLNVPQPIEHLVVRFYVAPATAPLKQNLPKGVNPTTGGKQR
jgi:hypothetical protein